MKKHTEELYGLLEDMKELKVLSEMIAEKTTMLEKDLEQVADRIRMENIVNTAQVNNEKAKKLMEEF